jgi:hypothetical protein
MTGASKYTLNREYIKQDSAMREKAKLRSVILWSVTVAAWIALALLVFLQVGKTPSPEERLAARQTSEDWRFGQPLKEILPETSDAVVIAKFVGYCRHPEAPDWKCNFSAPAARLFVMRVVSGQCDTTEFFVSEPGSLGGNGLVGKKIKVYLRRSPDRLGGFRIIDSEPMVGLDFPYIHYTCRPELMKDLTFEDFLDFEDWLLANAKAKPGFSTLWRLYDEEMLKECIDQWRQSR